MCHLFKHTHLFYQHDEISVDFYSTGSSVVFLQLSLQVLFLLAIYLRQTFILKEARLFLPCCSGFIISNFIQTATCLELVHIYKYLIEILFIY